MSSGGTAALGDAGEGAGGAPPGCSKDEDCEALLGETTPESCATAKCSVVTGECVFAAIDEDGDGYATATCFAEGVEVEVGDDCDDANPDTFPGAWDGPPSGRNSDDRCDERDNDCNGEVDDGERDGATCVCDPATDIDVPCDELFDGTPIEWPGGAAKGACRRGTKRCVDGVWSACEGAVLPQDQDLCTAGDDSTCDGVENAGCDCDSGETRACGSSVGSCEQGVQTCVDGVWSSVCEGEIPPEANDTCDADNDDNCNGEPHDNPECECVNGETRACGVNVGPCRKGTQTCVDGKWSKVCEGEIAPRPKDTCEPNNDDNCNGQPNDNPDCRCLNGEVKTCAAVYGSLGVCAAGTVTCVGGTWPASCPVTGRSELCNKDGVDEDCDGNPNNGCGCLNGDVSSNSCGTCSNGYRVCANGTYAGAACNGATGPWTYYRDADGDGYCNKGSATSQCSRPSGYLDASCPSDCRDNNAYIPVHTNRCAPYILGSTNARSCATFGGGCGVSNEWQISWDEKPGACPAGFHPKCYARWVSGNAGTQCWLAGESYDANKWSCRLHPSSAGFDGVTCAIDIECIPD